jgi:hypothetical protein
MYGAFVNEVVVYNMRAEQGERLAQEHWQSRHLRSAEGRLMQAILARAGAYLREVLCRLYGRVRLASRRTAC